MVRCIGGGKKDKVSLTDFGSDDSGGWGRSTCGEYLNGWGGGASAGFFCLHSGGGLE